MTKPINILLTGCGAPGATGIIHCLRIDERIRIYGVDMDPNASGRLLVDRFFQIPEFSHSNFIPSIQTICKKEDIDLILPIVTKELIPLTIAFQQGLLQSARLVTTDLQTLKTLNDKGSIYQTFQEASFIPKFYLVNDLVAVQQSFSNLEPAVVKPRVSNGSRGVRIVHNHFDSYDSWLNTKPGDLNMSKSDFLNILDRPHLPPLVVSEYLPGGEFTADVLFTKGSIYSIAIRTRDKMRAGISIAGKFVLNQEILRSINHIGATLNLHGFFGFQFKNDSHNHPKLLEVNPRLQGTTVAALGAGVNFPLLLVKQQFNELPPVAPQVEIGKSFSRVYKELFH